MSSNEKASAAIQNLTISKKSPGTFAEGAVVCHATADYDSFAAPSGAAAVKVLGVVTNAGGVVANDRANIQIDGQANCLMAASTTISQGDLIITAGADGSVKSRTNETTVDIVGEAMATRTSGASDAILIPVLLRKYRL